MIYDERLELLQKKLHTQISSVPFYPTDSKEFLGERLNKKRETNGSIFAEIKINYVRMSCGVSLLKDE